MPIAAKKPRTNLWHVLVLVLCLIPTLFMFATKAFDSYTNPIPTNLLVSVESFLGVVGMFGGIPLGLLSILIGTSYLLIRFRRMNWGFRVAFVMSNALAVAGMRAILSVWSKFSR
jgi:hypothetical protein